MKMRMLVLTVVMFAPTMAQAECMDLAQAAQYRRLADHAVSCNLGKGVLFNEETGFVYKKPSPEGQRTLDWLGAHSEVVSHAEKDRIYEYGLSLWPVEPTREGQMTLGWLSDHPELSRSEKDHIYKYGLSLAPVEPRSTRR